MTRRTVWITGVGAVTSAGPDTGSMAAALEAGRSGVRPLAAPEGVPAATAVMSSRDYAGRQLARASALFLAAAEEAWRSARLPDRAPDPEAAVVFEGTSLGSAPEMLAAYARRSERGMRVSRPLDIVRFLPGVGGAALAQRHGLAGEGMLVSAGSVSSACAIGEAAKGIASGTADLAVAGGAESPLQPDVVASFGAAGILAKPGEECRPFAAGRTGTALGEGAAAVVLEAAARARRRGVRPLAVLRGWGFAMEERSLTSPQPDGEGVATAVDRALEGGRNEAIGWIKAHGTGTQLGDAAEARGLAALLGPRLTRTPVTALKPLIGHCLGASAAVEMVAAILALQAGFVPPTLGTESVDPELPRLDLVTRRRRSAARTILCLSQSFGGRSAALFISRD